MSVWQVRHRVYVEQLADVLADRAELTGDQYTRLLAAAYVVLMQHQVDKKGRCHHCYRSWRRKQCTVHQVFATAMTQPLHVILDWAADH